MSGIIGFLRLLLKFGLPAYLLLVLGTAFNGYARPWKPAEEILTSHVGQTPVLVGWGYSSEHGETRNGVETSRSYILFPEVFRNPKVIVVTQLDDDTPVALDSEISLWLGLCWLAVSLYGTWWFWLRRTRKGAL